VTTSPALHDAADAPGLESESKSTPARSPARIGA
jgi:hypothetical protein